MRLDEQTPLDWRKAWSLYRSYSRTDSRGNVNRAYNATPDFVGADKSLSGVCWRILSAKWALDTLGESVTAGASFVLYDKTLRISPFDRCAFGGSTWEVRQVLEHSTCREIQLVEVRA